MVCTVGAGGVGITLAAAQTVILVDRPWTPGDCVQCEDRLHRIGQQNAVTSLWLQFGGLDLRVDALLGQKQQLIDQVLAGTKSATGELPGIAALAPDIMASIYEDTPVEECLTKYGLALPDGSELEETAGPETEQIAPPRRRARRHRPQNGLRKDGSQDRRVKGEQPKIRLNISVDEEMAAFLREMKTNNQQTTKEDGYSGFLAEQARASVAFQRWLKERKH